MECPEQVLVNTLKQTSEDTRMILLQSLSRRTILPSSVVNVASAWLNDCASKSLCIAILNLLGHHDNGLPNTILQGIAARLEDENRYVRQAAINALQGRADLTEGMLQGIAARLEHEDRHVRQAAIKALQGRADLTEGMLQGIAARLEDEDWHVRQAAINALQRRADLTEGMLQGIAARLEHKNRDVRQAAIKALQGRAALWLDALSPYIKPFYKALLQESFQEHIYWCASDHDFIVVNLRHIPLIGNQRNGKEAVVKLLLRKGATIVAMNGGRRPPLHLAAEN
ncbi:armadillo-type protein [Triangularia setosa]|uniref:Armadillo-type protein n=1 Tax=Triangularia setosa TaxID=2587417 RepID=A0AAN7A293_9PEZI|nr:armadillo-type protein [Podospora setosa]